jgi:hypothetical protein
VRATTATNLNKNAAASGACVAAAEKTKQRRYQQLCDQRGLILIPFAIESYGPVGPAAHAFLTLLASQSLKQTAESFLTHALTRIGVALQRGNAQVLRRGMQHLRASRWESTSASMDLPIDADSSFSPASHRRQQQLALNRGSQPLNLSSVFHSNFRAGGECLAAGTRRFLIHSAAA